VRFLSGAFYCIHPMKRGRRINLEIRQRRQETFEALTHAVRNIPAERSIIGGWSSWFND
jgi:hypothetical protein